MSLLPSVYQSTDPSAPVCSGLVGALTTILDAVLVNGYGAKAGLGWTIVDSGTNWRVYRHNPVSGSGKYLYVNDNASGTGGAREALLRGYRTWDVVTHTGTDPFPTTAQMSGGVPWKKSSSADAAARPWLIIGNERSVYVFLDCNSGVRQAFFAGDTVSYRPGDRDNYLISGASAQNLAISTYISETLLTGPGAGSVSAGGTATMGYFAANARGSATSVKAVNQAAHLMGAGTRFPFGSTNGYARPYPGVVSNGLDVARIVIFEGDYAERGQWPGLYQPLHSLPFADVETLPAAGPGVVDLLAVRYRRMVVGSTTDHDGQLLFELGAEW